MDFGKMYSEEDLFPRMITSCEARDYGFLFFSESNKDSFDSNHAVIFRDKVHDLKRVLADIIVFYKNKGIRPIIYQSIDEEGYFEEFKDVFSECGFECRTEEQKYMILTGENAIIPNPKIAVGRVREWEDAFATEIFEKAGEPWETAVAKRALKNKNTLFFAAYLNGQPVGMTYSHVSDGVCRVDYLLVSKEFRKIGVGRALIHAFTEYCRANKIENCFLWPDGESAEKIYYEAGFRHAATKIAGRAAYIKD